MIPNGVSTSYPLSPTEDLGRWTEKDERTLQSGNKKSSTGRRQQLFQFLIHAVKQNYTFRISLPLKFERVKAYQQQIKTFEKVNWKSRAFCRNFIRCLPLALYTQAECDHEFFSSYSVHCFTMLLGLQQYLHFYKPIKIFLFIITIIILNFIVQLHSSHCKVSLKSNATIQFFKQVQDVFQWR